MFKFSSKLFVISFVIFNLSLVAEDVSKYYDDLAPLNEAMKKIEEEKKLYLASLSESEKRILEGIEHINSKFYQAQDNNDISKLTTFGSIVILIDAFGVNDRKSTEFSRAARNKDLKKILECLNFGISEIDSKNLVSCPNMLGMTVKRLRERANELEEVNKLLNITCILTNEISCAQQVQDIGKLELLVYIDYFVSSSHEKIKPKDLLLKTLQDKDWKGAAILIESNHH